MKTFFCPIFCAATLLLTGTQQVLNAQALVPEPVQQAVSGSPQHATPHDHTRCGQQRALEQLYARHPEQRTGVEAAEAAIQDYLRNNAGNLRVEGETIYIPTVVHVVYKSAVQNITDLQVLSQIEVLNEDYSMTNLDRASLRSDFNAIAAPTGIQFCLAETDPDGNFTTGIVRKQTGKNSFNDTDTAGWDGVKDSNYGGSDPWPRTQYLNIWVCNLDPTSGVLGYAYPPGVGGAQDGVVINYRYFGRVGVLTPPYNLGRTTTHEVGHWLRLNHIWGGGCGSDDGISDTPNSAGPYFGCPSATATSCGSLDLWENYMDYTDDRCMVMFSAGQGEEMRAVLNTVRSSIPVSPKCYFNTGVEESPEVFVLPSIRVYPNPNNGSDLNIVLDRPLEEAGTVLIWDATGRLVYQQQQAAGWQSGAITMPALPDGFYLLQIQAGDQTRDQRFLVHH